MMDSELQGNCPKSNVEQWEAGIWCLGGCQTPRNISLQKEIASLLKYKSGGSQRHQFIKCTVEKVA